MRKERGVWKTFIFPIDRREISQDRDKEYIKDEERKGVWKKFLRNFKRDQSGQIKGIFLRGEKKGKCGRLLLYL